MDKAKTLKRIVIDLKVMTGKPVIRDTRLTVQYILGLLSSGATVEEILDEYKGLTREDILACLFVICNRSNKKKQLLSIRS